MNRYLFNSAAIPVTRNSLGVAYQNAENLYDSATEIVATHSLHDSAMFLVTIFNRWPTDFVTSDKAEIVFDTLSECEKYVENSKNRHPDRFYYSISSSK
ncbi:MAG: hypothetical protein DDT21_01893 [Syntrophomonadaceae bacterium]|nr:hypothetical protein [Bacillota bacterium]